MKAREKAEEMIEKYERYLYGFLSTDKEYARCVQCALMAVDEIINSNPHSNPLNTEVYSTMEWWQKVKLEIKEYGKDRS